MHKRLYNFREVNDILQPLQFGFRKNIPLSIITLISMAETIRKTIDNGNFGCGIFINLKKAFDTVNHSILAFVNLNIMAFGASHYSGFTLTCQTVNNTCL